MISSVGNGLLLFVGIEKGDQPETVKTYAEKVSRLRIFEDSRGKTNLSVKEVGGRVLVVSQFTLAADLAGGNRPSFDKAELPQKAQALVSWFCQVLQECGLEVLQGSFGDHMKVELVNDGPATYIL